MNCKKLKAADAELLGAILAAIGVFEFKSGGLRSNLSVAQPLLGED